MYWWIEEFSYQFLPSNFQPLAHPFSGPHDRLCASRRGDSIHINAI